MDKYEGQVYYLGPYDFTAQILDNLGAIDTAYLVYEVLRDGCPTNVTACYDTIAKDTLPMKVLQSGSFYTTEIPSTFYNINTQKKDTIKPRDSVYWRMEVFDISRCRNIRTFPEAEKRTKFLVRGNLPPGCTKTPISTFPYVQDFNSKDTFPDGTYLFPQSHFQNATGDFNEWFATGDTIPGDTLPTLGPGDDYPGGGRYLYVNGGKSRKGNPLNDSTAILLSPCFDLGELPSGLIRFYLHQNGGFNDNIFTVDIYDPEPRPGEPNGGYDYDVLPPIVGDKGDRWLPVELNTYPYRGKVIQLVFSAKPDEVALTHFGLDSFKLVPSPVHDVRANQLEIYPLMPHNDNRPVDLILNIGNLGQLPVDSVGLSFEVETIDEEGNLNGDTVKYPYYGIKLATPLEPGEFRNIQYEYPFPVPLGRFEVRATVHYQFDESETNNLTAVRATGINYRTADCEKEFFDSETTYWYKLPSDSTSNLNNWERGAPNYGRTNTPFSPPYAWDVLLNRPYTGNDVTEVLYTQFYDFTNMNDVMLSFMNNRSIDTVIAGVLMEYSLDQGVTWDSVPGRFDPNRRRWYNSYVAAGGYAGQPSFSYYTRRMEGNLNNWVESEVRLPSVFHDEKLVIFRFLFFAEQVAIGEDNSDEGMSIDNFLIYEPQSIDLDPIFFHQPKSKCYMTSTERIRTVIKNRGLNTVNSFEVEYIVKNLRTNAVQVKKETINRSIAPRDTIKVLSTPTFDMRSLGDWEVSAIVKVAGDGCVSNDTLTRIFENIDGCSFVFEVVTRNFPNITDPTEPGFNPKDSAVAALIDSSFYRFDYEVGGRNYRIEEQYVNFPPKDTVRRDICIKKTPRYPSCWVILFNLDKETS